MKLGILSDTHDLLRSEVIEGLQLCDVIVHAGDVCSRAVLETLSGIAPVFAVRGNADREEMLDLPDYRDFDVSGLRVYMTHKRKNLPNDLASKDLTSYDLVIYGHSHQWEESWRGHTLFLNPGSCGPRRFHLPITYAILHISDQGMRIERREILAGESKQATFSGNLGLQVETVVRETNKGKSCDEIARKYGLDPDLTEQIVRMLVTHPGVTTDGIMQKIESYYGGHMTT